MHPYDRGDYVVHQLGAVSGVRPDTFYAVILHIQRLVRFPEDITEDSSTLYIGFYLPELKMADLTNCSAASYTQRTFQEKTA